MIGFQFASVVVHARTWLRNSLEAGSLVEPHHGFTTLQEAKVCELMLDGLSSQSSEHLTADASALGSGMDRYGPDTEDAYRLSVG